MTVFLGMKILHVGSTTILLGYRHCTSILDSIMILLGKKQTDSVNMMINMASSVTPSEDLTACDFS